MSFSKFRKYWQHVSQTIPAFVCVLLLLSMTDGEGTVSFEMSMEELLSNGFTVSAAIATLENQDFSRSIELEIEDSQRRILFSLQLRVATLLGAAYA